MVICNCYLKFKIGAAWSTCIGWVCGIEISSVWDLRPTKLMTACFDSADCGVGIANTTTTIWLRSTMHALQPGQHVAFLMTQLGLKETAIHCPHTESPVPTHLLMN